jgi:hypothetical protein
MKLFKCRGRLLLWYLVIFSFIVCVPTWTLAEDADDDDEEEVDWREERRKIEADIAKMVNERLAKEVTRERVVTELARNFPLSPQWKYPEPEPKQTLQEINEELIAQLKEEVKVKFPASKREGFEKAAREKYKMWQRNDDVTFVIRGGRGPDTLVTGKLSRVSAERVEVFPRRTINIRDLDDETLARLYPVYHEKMVKEYVASENRRYDTQIEVYMMDERERRVPELFRKGGYIPNPGLLDMTAKTFRTRYNQRFTSPNPDHWISRSSFVKNLYDKLYAEKKAEFSDEIAKDIYQRKNYINVKRNQFKKLMESGEANDLYGWMPRSKYQEYLERQNAIIEEEKANAQPGDGGPGGPGMMNPGPEH